jgi:ketosteroid isomerase-like protein
MGSLACGGSGGSPATGDDADARRRPDGVAIDPSSAPPAARDRADASERLITLRTPLGADRAIATVAELFRRIVREDSEGLEALFTRDAVVVSTAPSQPTPNASATVWWGQRFHRLDYTKLAGETIFRESDVSIYRTEDLFETSPHPAIRADALGEGDVVIRVPILTPRVGQDRLLGDEMILWLRRDGAEFKIYRTLEDFQLP